jgi:hypothetical protein
MSLRAHLTDTDRVTTAALAMAHCAASQPTKPEGCDSLFRNQYAYRGTRVERIEFAGKALCTRMPPELLFAMGCMVATTNSDPSRLLANPALSAFMVAAGTHARAAVDTASAPDIMHAYWCAMLPPHSWQAVWRRLRPDSRLTDRFEEAVDDMRRLHGARAHTYDVTFTAMGGPARIRVV